MDQSLIYRESPIYSSPIITIADNHPIWINGTKMINGSPIIDDDHKDETRIEEFKKIGFSKVYIQWLTDSKYKHIYSSSKGSPLRWGNKTLNGTSYKGITAQNQIHDKEDYDIIHRIEIKDNHVYLNDILIASAPSGKTKAFKEKFCKSVVWSLMNDDITLKDKLSEISDRVIPEKVIDQGKITIEEITGYPEFKHFDDLKLSDMERSDLIEMNYDNPSDNYEEDHFSNLLMVDCIKEIIPEKVKSLIPVFPQGFIPWLNLTITEVCTA